VNDRGPPCRPVSSQRCAPSLQGVSNCNCGEWRANPSHGPAKTIGQAGDSIAILAPSLYDCISKRARDCRTLTQALPGRSPYAKEVWWGVLSYLGLHCSFNPPAASLSGWCGLERGNCCRAIAGRGMSTHCTSDARHLEHLEGAHLFNGEALVASDLASTPREARNRSLGAMPGLNI
jgi:hypothetical protein